MHIDYEPAGGHAFRWGVELTPDCPVSEVADLGVAAERASFDAVFASCHYGNRDPFVALGQVAAATESVRLGPGVVNPYEAHPVQVASRAATLDEASGGRALFGIGAGDRSTLANLGIDRERPLRTVLEAIRAARWLWAGERVDHDGTFVAADAALNYPARPLPVFVGAQGPGMLRMAAKYADGVLVNAAHPTDYEWATEQVAAGLDERPEERGTFTVAAFACVSVAEDEAAARAVGRRPVAYVAAGAPDRVLDRHGLDAERAVEIGAAISAGERDRAYDLVTPEMLDAFCVAGTPETVAEGVATIGEHVDAFVAGSPLGPDRERAIDLLGEVRDSLAEPAEVGR